MRNEAAAILPEADVVPIRPSRQFLLQQATLNFLREAQPVGFEWHGAADIACWVMRWFVRDGQLSDWAIQSVTRHFRTLCVRYNIEVTP